MLRVATWMLAKRNSKTWNQLELALWQLLVYNHDDLFQLAHRCGDHFLREVQSGAVKLIISSWSL